MNSPVWKTKEWGWRQHGAPSFPAYSTKSHAIRRTPTEPGIYDLVRLVDGKWVVLKTITLI